MSLGIVSWPGLELATTIHRAITKNIEHVGFDREQVLIGFNKMAERAAEDRERWRRLGQSAFIGIGSDPMLGTTTRDALHALDADLGTDAAVIVGEIGGAIE